MKAFENLALIAVPEAAIGEDTVHIKGHQANGLQTFDHLFCQRGQKYGLYRMGRSVLKHGIKYKNSWFHLEGQITLAAKRSCICKAPITAPFSSSTNN